MKVILGLLILAFVLVCAPYSYSYVTKDRLERTAGIEIENNNFYDARVKVKHLGHPILNLFVRSGQTVQKEVDSIYDTIYFTINFIGVREVWTTEEIYLTAGQVVMLRIGQTRGMTYLSRR